MSRRMHESDQAKSSGSPDWWRILEATLASVGSVADSLLDMNEEQEMDEVVDLRQIVEGFGLKRLFVEVIPQLARMQGEWERSGLPC